MKNIQSFLLLIVIINIFFSSCATIAGGTTYLANVRVPKHPNAKISYQGINKGVGTATFLVPRKYANRFSIDIEEPGCTRTTVTFHSREFRIFAFIGTILGWTGITTTGVPIPWGLLIDGATGAFWKPDVTERGVSKLNYKYFIYTIDYYGCEK